VTIGSRSYHFVIDLCAEKLGRLPAVSRRMIVLILSLWGTLPAWALENETERLDVHVSREGDSLLIDAVAYAPVSAREAWAVLTDFEHMAEFMPNLQSSIVQSQTPSTMRVSQKGTASLGPLSFSFDTVREIDLTPFSTITFHLISGTMEKLDGLTQLSQEDSGTRIAYHAVAIPGHLLPLSLAEPFISRDVRESFQAFLAEMNRRRQLVARNQHRAH
jgi:carbon monoxide dehydrogenase subunit G